MIGTFHRAFERAGVVLAYGGMFLISISIGISIVDIVARKTIGWSMFGITDMGQLLVMSCICLAMPLTFIREGHVGVEFATDPLPPRALAALNLLVAVTTFVVVAVLARYALSQATLQWAKGDRTATLAIPMIWYWTPLLIGLGVSSLGCIVQIVRHGAIVFASRDPLGHRP